MKVPPWLTVGVCSHPGRVRRTNEDDYLLGAVPGSGELLAAIADGMGGLAGGAEASRIALRSLGSVVLDGPSPGPVQERLRLGCGAARDRVLDAGSAVPALRDMGTTLTALLLRPDTATIAHVGDTRVYRLRGGRCERLTTDHAVQRPDNLLTRCIGAGQGDVEPDLRQEALLAGDRFVLVSDGVWSVLDDELFAARASRSPVQQAAEDLVLAALAAGGPDNATAIVVEVGQQPGAAGPAVEVDLPRHERPEDPALWPSPRSLRLPVWPWWLLAVAALVLGDAGCRLVGGEGLVALWRWWIG
ncbi:MAG: PP2C family serine/threonine-protein phosphatase [Planctomycetota bacterium]